MPRFTKEQQEAIDLEGSNILVSAGAGSGKTAVLSERVLRKVKEGVSVDDLLILTFTNAAAAEMKERIRKKIKAVPKLKKESEKVASAYITTFDAFTLAIVKKYHYLKDLDKDITVCDASILDLKKDEILETLFLELYEKEDEKFLKLINDYSLKNDNEIKTFIKSSQKNIDLIYEKDEYLNNYINYFYNEKKIEEYISKYIALIKEQVTSIKNSFEEMERMDSEYTAKIDFSLLFKATTYDDYKEGSQLKLPIKRGASDEFKEEKEKLSSALKRVIELTKYQSEEAMKKDYLNSLENVETILFLVKEFDARVTKLKFTEKLFDFLDIEKMAIDILKENEEVRLFYKEKFNEILIDEYQDTSDIQETFTDLISKNNVYMVGDIKQSIYRFRNANPIIFKDKYENYGEDIGGKRIDLNKNFRSREEVLTNINLMFDPLMDAPIGGANYKEEHRLIFGNMMYNEEGFTGQNNNFEVLNYEKDENKIFSNEEIEIFTIAKDIKEKVESGYVIFDKDENIKRPAKYDDFAILLDRSSSFNNYKKVFEYLNIPLSIYKDESIKNSNVIKIIKNIFILINNISLKKYDKDFKYAFASISRSFIQKLDDDILFEVITENKFFETELFQKCKNIAEDIEVKNIYDIFKQIVDDFDFYKKVITVGEVVKENVILEYLLKMASSAANIYTIDEFINYLDNITAGDLDIKYSLSKEDENGVYMMTIHKSKGLEFPVVYFAGLDKSFNILELKEKFIFSKELGFIIPVKDKYFKTLFTKVLLKDNYIKDEISEKLRLFYVALTRAKEKMIFVMDYKNDKNYKIVGNVVNNEDRLAYRSFAHFLSSISKVIYPYVVNVDISNIGLTKDYNFSKKTDYKSKIKKVDKKVILTENKYEKVIEEKKHFSKSSKELFSKEAKTFITTGLELHLIMEYIDFKNPNYELVDKKYQSIVKSFLDLDIIQGYKNIYKEYEFIYYKDNDEFHGIIDLLLEFEDKFIIIDYKLKNTSNDAYVAQLNGYKEYIEKMSNKKCLIYLYSFIDKSLTQIKEEF